MFTMIMIMMIIVIIVIMIIIYLPIYYIDAPTTFATRARRAQVLFDDLVTKANQANQIKQATIKQTNQIK